MRRLDRAGIFRARPLSWRMRSSDSSQAVAVSMEFLILEQLDGSKWASWSEYEEHNVYGDFYVVKKDGSVNATIVEQLVSSLGWSGDLRDLAKAVPDVVVQITVKADEWGGQTRYKAEWLNPGDYVPLAKASTGGSLDAAQARFGSLLRAAAAAAKPPAPATPSPARPAPSAPPPANGAADQARCPISDEPLDAPPQPKDDLPF